MQHSDPYGPSHNRLVQGQRAAPSIPRSRTTDLDVSIHESIPPSPPLSPVAKTVPTATNTAVEADTKPRGCMAEIDLYASRHESSRSEFILPSRPQNLHNLHQRRDSRPTDQELALGIERAINKAEYRNHHHHHHRQEGNESSSSSSRLACHIETLTHSLDTLDLCQQSRPQHRELIQHSRREDSRAVARRMHKNKHRQRKARSGLPIRPRPAGRQLGAAVGRGGMEIDGRSRRDQPVMHANDYLPGDIDRTGVEEDEQEEEEGLDIISIAAMPPATTPNPDTDQWTTRTARSTNEAATESGDLVECFERNLFFSFSFFPRKPTGLKKKCGSEISTVTEMDYR